MEYIQHTGNGMASTAGPLTAYLMSSADAIRCRLGDSKLSSFGLVVLSQLPVRVTLKYHYYFALLKGTMPSPLCPVEYDNVVCCNCGIVSIITSYASYFAGDLCSRIVVMAALCVYVACSIVMAMM